MSEKKILMINPDLFSFSKKSTRKKRESKATNQIKVKTSLHSSQNMSVKKKAILKMIRQHQEDRHKIQSEQPSLKPTARDNNPINSELKSAQLFFENLAEKNRHNVAPKNTTIKQYSASAGEMHENVRCQLPEVSHHIARPVGPTLNINPAATIRPPKYGCLKNGELPTFRSYMNQTRKQPPITISPGPLDRPVPKLGIQTTSLGILTHPMGSIGGTSPSQNRISEITDMAKQSIQHSSQQQQLTTKINQSLATNSAGKYRKRKRKRTIRRTYKIGKSKIMPKISVLVSNKTIRNQILTKTQLLKQTSIQDIKRSLIKHGLIRIGSTTPNDVLRKMYESAQMVCGEIHNHNPDNLLYNFINSSHE
jgi:hypothetical protein